MTIEELKADLKNCRIAIRVKDEEVSRLKAELDKYRKDVTNSVDDLLDERKRLKAEVERLTAKQTDISRVQAQSDFYRSKLVGETAYTANIQLLDQVKHLQAQVERLTKAGDALAEQLDGLSFDTVWDFWNAAKEGKQP